MRSLASSITSWVISAPWSLIVAPRRSGAADERTDRLTDEGSANVAGLHDVEHDDRQPVVHAEGDRGGVHHREATVEHFEVADLGEFHRVGMLEGIRRVDAVDTGMGALQDGFRTDLRGS